MEEKELISLKKEFRKDILGIVLFPSMLIIMSIVFFFLVLFPTINVINEGGRIAYSDTKFANYRDAQYNKYFEDSSAENDNMVIIYLVNDDYNSYRCIAKLGKNVDSSITTMFGNGTSSFGQIVINTVNPEYRFTLGKDVISVMDQMSDKIVDLKLDSSFKAESDRTNLAASRLVNNSRLDISETEVNKALASFTEKTGIPAVIVVDTMENAFGRVAPIDDIILLIVLLAVAGIGTFVMIRKIVLRVRFEKVTEPQNTRSPYDRNDIDDIQ